MHRAAVHEGGVLKIPVTKLESSEARTKTPPTRRSLKKGMERSEVGEGEAQRTGRS
jgi:hypothetical protein